MEYKIGIVGNGFVGNALYQVFNAKYETKIFDIVKEKSINTLEEVLNTDIIFVCLPTPMKYAEGGECNLSIINTFFDNLGSSKSLFVVKSTVPVGTVKKIKQKHPNLKIIHNPEFLTAINAVQDFKNSDRNILGGSYEDCLIAKQIYDEMFPNAMNIIVDSDESEMIKYFANGFLATKVAFFNIMYDMCEKLNVNYSNVVLGVASDKRIGFSHTKVPGPDLDRGFGGTCFPKDINSLIHICKELNLNSSIFEEVWEYNKKIRKNWDWKYNRSATNDN